ncbi:MAG: tetratricopeptide repeat protein [Candidatus Sulfotelmatobacter sp.]
MPERARTFRNLRGWKRLFLATVLLACIAAAVPIARAAQSTSDADDPRVEKLYSEAKEAQARGDQAEAIAKYESILKVAPRLGAAYNNLGMLYFQQRDYRQAIAVLEKGLAVDPKMASASALLGISFYEAGDYGKSRARLEAALRSNPKDNHAELFLANDLIKLGDLQAAARHLEELARREPSDQEVFYLLGEVYMQLSEKALTKLNTIDPNSVYVHEMSGEIMESMKNYDGAVVEYKKAIEMAPQQAGTHYKLGNTYWLLGEWDAAIKELQAELVNDPTNCKAQAQIANILIEQRMNFEEGLASVDKALAACPDLTQARIDRGRALLKLNRNDEAAKELEAAERSSPDDASTHFFLAQAYRALGRSRDAQTEMQLFSKLEESARDAKAERAKEVLQNKEEAH